MREFSDFLQQVKIEMNQLHSLKILEDPSKLQTLVEKLPDWFLTKWYTKGQTLHQEKGCNAFSTFMEFVGEVIFHADPMHIPQISSHRAKNLAWNSLGTTSTTNPITCKRIYATTMESKATAESKFLSPEKKRNTIRTTSKNKDICLFHKTMSHTLNDCNKFQDLALDDRRDIFKNNKLCFKFMASNKHNANKQIKHLQCATSAARDISCQGYTQQ